MSVGGILFNASLSVCDPPVTEIAVPAVPPTAAKRTGGDYVAGGGRARDSRQCLLQDFVGRIRVDVHARREFTLVL